MVRIFTQSSSTFQSMQESSHHHPFTLKVKKGSLMPYVELDEMLQTDYKHLLETLALFGNNIDIFL